MDLRQQITAVGTDIHTARQTESYRLPESWAVREYRLQEKRALGERDIEAAITAPFPYKGGTSSIARLARGKADAVILIDDITRPTPAHVIVPHVLRRLTAAGIARDRISFLFAIGLHRPLSRAEMALKIGGEVTRAHSCENHDPFGEDLADLGSTPFGTPVLVNRKVAEADLVIAFGTFARHKWLYAHGGSKIILPGVSHRETILANHKGMTKAGPDETHRFGRIRADIDETAKKVAEVTDFVVIDVTLNRQRQVIGVYIGDSVGVFSDHIDAALRSYSVEFSRAEYDASGKADVGFFRMSTHSCDPLQLNRSVDNWDEVCDVPVIIADCRDRYYYDGKVDGPYEAYLKTLKRAELRPNPALDEALQPKGFGQMIVCSPHLDPKSTHLKHPGIYVANDWESLIRALYARLGRKKQVAFFHDASLHALDVR